MKKKNPELKLYAKYSSLTSDSSDISITFRPGQLSYMCRVQIEA
jgi:hypothetical protein